MKKFLSWLHLAVVMLLSITAGGVHAIEIKFNIFPVLVAPSIIPSNGVALAQYLITNNTAITRELTIVPISGVFPFATGLAGGCNFPFVLMSGQTCLLTLRIIGPAVVGAVHSEIKVCSTLAPGQTIPDPYLCSRTAPGAGIDVDLGFPLTTTITVTPSPLRFSVAKSGVLTVTNTDPIIIAQNITATFLGFAPIAITANTCPALLLPGASCTISLGAIAAGATTLSILGMNTNQLFVPIIATSP